MSYNYLFKLIVIGDPGVGKTALVQQLTKKQFPHHYETTIGIDFATKTILIDDNMLIKSHIWDTAGQENFASIIASYYREVAGAMVVFDLTNAESFDHCAFWLSELDKKKRSEKDISMILIGNKMDESNRQVSKEEAEKYAKDHNMMYMETSAKTGENAELFYTQLILHIYKHMDPEGKMIGIKKHFSHIPYDTSSNKIRKCDTMRHECCSIS